MRGLIFLLVFVLVLDLSLIFLLLLGLTLGLGHVLAHRGVGDLKAGGDHLVEALGEVHGLFEVKTCTHTQNKHRSSE